MALTRRTLQELRELAEAQSIPLRHKGRLKNRQTLINELRERQRLAEDTRQFPFLRLPYELQMEVLSHASLEEVVNLEIAGPPILYMLTNAAIRFRKGRKLCKRCRFLKPENMFRFVEWGVSARVSTCAECSGN